MSESDIKNYKQKILDQLHKKFNFDKCPVGTNSCTQTVWGTGNPNAKLMFIGEAPGRDEDEQGKPFVGRSGKLLTKCLSLAGISRDNVFITNIVKCRPPGNRKPLPPEVAFYKPILMHEIKIVRPRVICTLGSSALESLIERPFLMTKIRGAVLSFDNIELIPTFHPAYVLRNPPAEKEFLEDIKKAIERAYQK